MFDFENIHKNHKWAFVDGLLCGIVLAWIGKLWYNALHPSYMPDVDHQDDPQSPNNVHDLSDYAEQR